MLQILKCVYFTRNFRTLKYWVKEHHQNEAKYKIKDAYPQLLSHAYTISDPSGCMLHPPVIFYHLEKTCPILAERIPAYFPWEHFQLPILGLYKSSARDRKHTMSKLMYPDETQRQLLLNICRMQRTEFLEIQWPFNC